MAAESADSPLLPPVIDDPEPPPLTPTIPAKNKHRTPWWPWLTSHFWQRFDALFLRELPPLLQRLTPRVLHPSFFWPPLLLDDDRPLASRLHPRPTLTHNSLPLRLAGRLHRFLRGFSRYYCACDGTSLDEVMAMRAVRAAGVPAPRVVAYGEHPDTPWAGVSILMTRLPGTELRDVLEEVLEDGGGVVERELGVILGAMRGWENPAGRGRICSISGGAIRSVRVPLHTVGPCEGEDEFTAYLIGAASSHSFKTEEEFEECLAKARVMEGLRHEVVFSHGDFFMHDIMVYEGRISGIIDWETAGWYPDYWEFTTPLRWASMLHDWRGLLLRLGGDRYAKELEAGRAIRTLTVDSWIW